jgi:TolB-like protein/Flp pilus assembly protein TadD
MPSETTNLRDHPADPPAEDRLNSWKEIAAYLKHSERTVRRWQDEGLPVYRHAHKKRAGVYAYKPELDAWWNDGHARLEELERAQAARGRPWLSWLSAMRSRAGPPSEPAAPQARPGLSLKLIAAFSLVGIAALLLWFNVGKLRTRIFARSRPLGIHSLAVLPLENLTNDPEQEYFSDGMTDELITDLAKIQSLRVISRNSVMPYKGKHRSVSEIGQELNVDAVVEGTVMRSGNRVRIRAQLIEARTDRHLWAQAYEGDVRDVLKLQDQVAQAIAAEIKGKLAPEEKVHLTSSTAVNPDAHEADLRGFYELHKHGAAGTFLPVGSEIEKAIKFFQQALSIDPNDALAYAGLGAAYYDQSTFFRAPLEAMPKAKTAAAKAIELDDSLAEAHASLGYVKLTFDWDWAGAGQEFRRALELNPNLASGHAGYAHYLLTLGRSEEAIQELAQLKNVDPLFPQSHVGLPYTLWNLRLYEEAVEAAKKENDERMIALSRIEQGRNEEAVAAADRAMKVARNPVILAQLAYVYARAGMKDKARTILRGLEAQVKQRYVCGFNVACLYTGLGDKEQAYAWLERAYRDRSD